MNRTQRLLFYISFLVCLISCSNQPSSNTNQAPVKKDTSVKINKEQIKADSIISDTSTYLTLCAVGDIMVHDYQMNKAYNAEKDSFDFDPVFSHIKTYLQDADITIGNLETTFAGKDQGRNNDIHGYATFPYFNAPENFAYTLKEAGFDILSTANNHSLDSYAKGVFKTLDILDSFEIVHIGTARSLQEQEQLCIIEKNNIKVGFCAYTNSLNGINKPDSLDFMINDLLGYKEEKLSRMANEVRAIRKNGADFTVAYIHCGTEYQKHPNRYQKLIADSLCEAECDLILMSHPHILQSFEVLTKNDSLGKTHNTLIIYSLGNFLSSQVYKEGVSKDVGTILQISLEKNELGTNIKSVQFIPTYNYWQRDHIGIVPLIKAHEYPDEYSFLRKRDTSRIHQAYKETLKTLQGKTDTSLWKKSEEKYTYAFED